MSKILKIAHVGDLHIRPYKMHEEYREIFNLFYKQLDELKIDRIIIAGDVCHSKIIVSNEMYLLLAEFLSNCSKRCKVIMVSGNHDTLLNSDRVDSITPVVKLLNDDNIKYYKESGCYQDEDDDSIVYCIWSCLENQKDPEIKLWKQQNDPENKKTYIGIYHGVVWNSKTSTNFQFDSGINTTAFDDCDITCLADIHLYQTFRNDEIVYCSSTLQQNYGELPDNHGFILWERNKNNKFNHEMIELKNDYGFYTLELDGFENLKNI